MTAEVIVLAERQMPTRLGMNALQPCGTDAARRRHLAHGQVCAVCEPTGVEVHPRRARCPQCGTPTDVVDGKVAPHFARVVRGNQVVESGEPCAGEGEPVGPLNPTVVALRARRLALGFTQAEVATRAGMNRQSVTNFEAGLPMSSKATAAVADALGCDLVQTLAPRGPA